MDSILGYVEIYGKVLYIKDGQQQSICRKNPGGGNGDEFAKIQISNQRILLVLAFENRIFFFPRFFEGMFELEFFEAARPDISE